MYDHEYPGDRHDHDAVILSLVQFLNQRCVKNNRERDDASKLREQVAPAHGKDGGKGKSSGGDKFSVPGHAQPVILAFGVMA